MKLKYEFVVRDIMGDFVMVPLGAGALEFSGIVSTSETGALLVDMLSRDVTREELLEGVLAEYDIDPDTALTDIEEFLGHLRKLGLLIEN